MDKNILSIVLLVVGLTLGYVVGINNGSGDDRFYGMHMMSNGQGMESMMSGMTGSLEGKTGDEFDRMFLRGMIVHHEGAVRMAEMALENTKRQEIKTMSEAIISTQTSEIAQMKSWLEAWYK